MLRTMIGMVVETFFALRCYRCLSIQRRRPFLVAFALTQCTTLGLAIYIASTSVQAPTLAAWQLDWRAHLLSWANVMTGTDLVITAILIHALIKQRKQAKESYGVLNSLIFVTMASMSLPLIAFAVYLVMIAGFPGRAYGAIPFIVQTKLYGISLLYSLNVRKALREQVQEAKTAAATPSIGASPSSLPYDGPLSEQMPASPDGAPARDVEVEMPRFDHWWPAADSEVDQTALAWRDESRRGKDASPTSWLFL